MTPRGETVWEWVTPFATIILGRSRPWIFRAYRYGPDFPGLASKSLDPARYADPDVLDVVQKQAKQRRESIEEFRKGGRQDLADREAAELAILEAYLPQQLSRDEVTAEVRAVITDVGASGPGDKAKVIETLKKSFEYARQAINATSDADLDRAIKIFGQDGTVREVCAAAAFRCEDQTHIVVRATIGPEEVYLVLGDIPLGISRRIDLPPHVIYRMHLGQVIRLERSDDAD